MPGQPAKREVDVSHLQLDELDVAEQLDQVPDHAPVARHDALCLRVQGLQPVLQALLDGVFGRCADDLLAEEEDKRHRVNRARRTRSRMIIRVAACDRERGGRPL